RGLSAAARLARSLGIPLRVEAFGDSAALAEGIARVKPESVAPYFSGPRVEQALAAGRIPRTRGTFADFVMLNRNGIAPDADRVAFAVCPTVHARDDRSLIE